MELVLIGLCSCTATDIVNILRKKREPFTSRVVLTDGKVRGRRKGGDWQTGDGKIGDVFWSEAETHEVENISGRNLRALLIELKPGAGVPTIEADG